MDVYYGYETALWYLRTALPRTSAPSRVTRTITPESYAHTDKQEREERPNWLDPELIGLSQGAVAPLAFYSNHRSSKGSLNWRLWRTVPRNAFIPAGEGSFVASPEFCFLQMASELEFSELVLLGMELCGFYRLDPREEEGFAKLKTSLTTRERIGTFLGECEGLRGKRAAETALQYVQDRAASPMESAIYLLLCLPHKRGGYCLPRPELNYPIDLVPNAVKLLGTPRCWGDICWPDHNLDLEYLGVASHDGKQNMLADRRRTLAIEESGYEVVEITKEQALDPVAFDIVARRLAARLHKRLGAKDCGQTEQRRRLFSVVYRWQSEIRSQEEAGGSEDAMYREPEEEGRVFGRRV